MVKFEVEKVSRKGNTSVGVIDVPANTTVDALTDLLQEKSTPACIVVSAIGCSLLTLSQRR